VAVSNSWSNVRGFGHHLETGILLNNRTVNGSSAAEPEYDEFFELLQEQTNRSFPALSGTDVFYYLAVGGGRSVFTSWTPLAVWSHRLPVENAHRTG
jgi:hypothetical protein